MSEDSDCVNDDFDTLTRETDILCKDLGLQLFHYCKQGPAAVVKKINKRKQITDITNYKKTSKLNFLTNETDTENITEKQNINTNINCHDEANVGEQNVNTNNIVNELRNHKPSIDIDRFTLTDENCFRIISDTDPSNLESLKVYDGLNVHKV